MLNLRDFMHRSRVLALYRSFLRELVGLDPSAAQEMRGQIREGFRKHIGETNKANQKSLMNDASRELQFVRTYVGTARRARQAAGVGQDESSWVGTGEEWDVRGRIGNDWAWERDEDAPKGVSGMGPRRVGGGDDSLR